MGESVKVIVLFPSNVSNTPFWVTKDPSSNARLVYTELVELSASEPSRTIEAFKESKFLIILFSILYNV